MDLVVYGCSWCWIDIRIAKFLVPIWIHSRNPCLASEGVQRMYFTAADEFFKTESSEHAVCKYSNVNIFILRFIVICPLSCRLRIMRR